MFVRYRIDRESSPHFRIYDAAGRLVQSWEESARTAGSHEAAWDGRDRNGMRVAAGSYVMTLESGTQRESARVVILR
jgi:flagellar hook assembly protein FlgD